MSVPKEHHHQKQTGTPRPRRTLGRHDLTGSYDPPGGFATPPAAPHNRRAIGMVAVSDPWDPTGKGRVRALARIDLLNREKKHGHIDEAGLKAGEAIEFVLERGRYIGGGGQWNDGSRVDAAAAHEVALLRGAIAAHQVKAYMAWLVKILGRRQARIVIRILGPDRLNYAEVARLEGKDGERGAKFIAATFRECLADVAQAAEAIGPQRGGKPRVSAWHAPEEPLPDASGLQESGT